jgi:hypothetical protein
VIFFREVIAVDQDKLGKMGRRWIKVTNACLGSNLTGGHNKEKNRYSSLSLIIYGK